MIERSLPNRIHRLEVSVENLRYDLARLIEGDLDDAAAIGLQDALSSLRTVACHLADALGHAEVAARGGQPHPLADALAARSA